MKMPVVLLAGLLFLACNESPASDRQWFVGVSADKNDHDFYIDDTDRSWSLYAGRMFGEYFFVELNYADQGSFAYRNIPALGGPTSVEVESLGAAVGARLPVFETGLSLSVAAGLHRWKRDYTVQLDTGSERFGSERDSSDPWQIVRLSYRVSESFDLFVQHSRFEFREGAEDADIAQIGAGIETRF